MIVRVGKILGRGVEKCGSECVNLNARYLTASVIEGRCVEQSLTEQHFDHTYLCESGPKGVFPTFQR